MTADALHKTVTTIMDKNLIVVAVNDPIETIERIFRIHRRNYASVLDENGDYFGLITASNLLEFQMAWKNIGALYARDICINKVIASGVNTSLRQATELMVRKNADFLVVMEEQQVLGVVSLMQLLKAVLQELDPSIPGLKDTKGYFAHLN